MKIITPFSKHIALILLVVIPVLLFGQKPKANQVREILPHSESESVMVKNRRIDKITGIPRAIYNPNYSVKAASPKAMALQYLNENLESLKLRNASEELSFIKTISAKTGYRVLFEQQSSGYPVYKSDIKVSINKDNKVVFVSNNYKALGKVDFQININEDNALHTAKTYLEISGKTEIENIRTVVYNHDRTRSEIAFQINIIPLEEQFGDWEMIISASSGDILRVEDRACYYHPQSDTVDGSGWVFDPDPITRAMTTYGSPGFTDNNDADSEELTAQLFEVVLEDITLEDTMYYLKGPYAEVVDAESPYKGLFKQTDSAFNFTRSPDAFEAVNCYHHIHQSMKYLNEELGFDIMPYQYTSGVRFDPHGLNGADNSYYQPGNGRVTFGEGGVDDAEDVGVVVHELGHGIHDWVTSGNLSQVDGLSEGLGDYWVTSYIRSTDFWGENDPENNWVFIWDGHNPFWPGRVTNDPGHYPEALVGQVHKDGQLWSSSLMQIWDLIGREATDSDCWEGISMTGSSSSQVDAAMAFMQADIDLYGGENLEEIASVFVARGYIESLVTVDFMADQTGGVGPLEVDFSDESVTLVGEITSWEWDFNGDGEVDSYEQNPTHTFTEVGGYTVSLTVSNGLNYYTELRENYITVNGGFYVYEPAKGQRDHSGIFIKNFLDERDYDAIYSNYYPTSLEGFDGVFISLGNFGSGITNLSDQMAAIIIAYLDEGGKVYLESGDAFGHDQVNNAVLLKKFGLVTAVDGQTNPIDALRGETFTLFAGLYFNGTNQTSVNYIDKYTPDESAGTELIFQETGYGNVGVGHIEAGIDHRTICFSYALSELQDFSGHSSRYNTLVIVMDFFGYPEGEAYVVANFSQDKSSVLENEEVSFTDWSATPLEYEVNSWKWDFDGDGSIDSEEQNPVWNYSNGGVYDVTLIASNGIDTDTLTREGVIFVRSGILVYEEMKNTNGFSGTFIYNYLQSQAFDELTYVNELPADLSGYDAVFTSFGNSGFRITELTGEMATTLQSYTYQGGRLYLEGGDALRGNQNLWLTFGLEDVQPGQENELTDLAGQNESLAAGLSFAASDQIGQKSIDKYAKLDDVDEIKIAFTESNYGDVAVQFDGIELFQHKTFCFSYALADLVDGEGVSNREELLIRILNFFDIIITDIEDNQPREEYNLSVYPNPGNNQLNIEYSIQNAGNVTIEVFDLSGREIKSNQMLANTGVNRLSLNTSLFGQGVYFIQLTTRDNLESVKWVKVD